MDSDAIRVLLIGNGPAGEAGGPDWLPESVRSRVAITYATTVEEAIDAHARTPFDVAGLELGAVERGGLGRLRALVAAAPALPVVAITDDDPSGLLALRAGAEHHFQRGASSWANVLLAFRSEIARQRPSGESPPTPAPPLLPPRAPTAFVTGLFHEMRTPLRVVSGFTSMIRERAEETGDEEILAHLPPLERAAQRVLAAIGNVLDLSRTEAGGFPLKPEPIALGPFVRAQVEEWLPAAAGKGLEVSCRLLEPRAAVRFDEYCLVQAFANLLQNAIRFTTAGSVRVVLFRNDEGVLQLDVRDTGIGIEPEHLKGIFEPLAGGEPESGNGSSGLGLSLAASFLAMNGADVRARSESGLGSCFSIHFPAALEVGLPEAGAREPEPPSRRARRRDAVLLVEDDRDHQELVRWLLEKRFEVHVAESAAEARDCLAQHSGRIRLVLMDLSIAGGESGLDLTRWLRKLPRWQNVPILAVTAHALDEDRALALEAGCSEVLTKPFDPGELLSTVGRWVKRRRDDAARNARHLRLASSR